MRFTPLFAAAAPKFSAPFRSVSEKSPADPIEWTR